MAKMTMQTSMAGERVSLARGDTHNCDIDEAVRLFIAGFAVAADEETQAAIDKATAEAEAAARAQAEADAKAAAKAAKAA